LLADVAARMGAGMRGTRTARLIIHGARGDVGMMNAHPTSEGMPP
jgi:hypothetical protein